MKPGDNIGSLWSDFSQNAGFHGVNKMTSGSKVRCVWWTVAVLGMTGFMVYNITRELINYYSHPTVTNVHVQLVEELSFPAVTICNQSPYSLAKVQQLDPEVESYYIKNSFVGGMTQTIDWESEFQEPIFQQSLEREWLFNISMDSSELILMCFFGGTISKPCPVKRILTNHGVCYTYNHNVSDVKTARLTGNDLNFIMFANIEHDDYVSGSQLAAGLRVILHEPEVHPDAASSSFLTAPGTSTYAVLTKSSFRYLPPPFKAFGHRTCLDTAAPGYMNPLEFYDTYTYNHCMLECQARKLYEICGCSRPQDDESLQPRCSLRSMVLCQDPEIGKFRTDPASVDSCACEIPCSFTSYEARISTSLYPSNDNAKLLLDTGIVVNESKESMRSSFLEVRLYYENLMISTTEQTPQYTTESLIGNLGGQMGICLGASVLTLTELGEFIICVFLACLKRITNVGDKSAVQPSSKVIPRDGL